MGEKTLEGILEAFTVTQGEFLLLRAKGLSVSEAAKCCGVSESTGFNWRRESAFKEAEEWVTSTSNDVAEKAELYLYRRLPFDLVVLLKGIISKADDFDKLPPTSQRMIIKAAELLAKLTKLTGVARKPRYESKLEERREKHDTE